LDVQFYFVDNQQAITDSLLNNASAVFHGVPMSGIVTSPTSSKLVVELTPQLIQRLLTSDGFLIKAKVNSAQNQHYQLYSHYGLSIRIVGDFSYAL
jgi:hypothetical protein